MQVYPDYKEVQTGDTLWMYLRSPKRFIDAISGQEIDFSNAANLGVDITFYQFAEDSNGAKYLNPAVKYFNYHLVKGRFLPDDRGSSYNLDYNFQESDSTYEFQLGIVPKSKGEFLISPYDVSNVYRKNARCPRAAFQITLTHTNQHLDIYNDFRPGFELAYEKRLYYCFKVK